MSVPLDSSVAPTTPQIGVLLTGSIPAASYAADATSQGLLTPLALPADFTLPRLRQLRALVIPFGTRQSRVWDFRAPLFEFMRFGGRVLVQADGPIPWLPNAIWENRPNRNHWWVLHPDMVASPDIDSGHPAFLAMRGPHALWHARGAFTQVPEGARVVQRNPSGEVLTWETRQYGGAMLVSTLDLLPEAESGIQRISPVDRYREQLTNWLLDRTPETRRRPIGSAVNLFAFATMDEAESKGV